MNKLVSLITRTKNRPLFIPRVFKTVVEQSYRPIEWIIVNDNGESIDTLLEELKLQYAEQYDGIEIILTNKTDLATMGAAAAANTGLVNAHGYYIKLLDDDDTLDRSCIEKQVHYMENEKLPSERGVICHTQNIYEKIENNQIRFISSSPLPLTLENITITDLAQDNQFTIHSFLYEKEVIETIGRHNEALPVFEDWEFNLRFISAFDIGVIPEFLVNYHIRREGQDNNSIISARSKYMRYDAVVRNQFVRNQEKYGSLSTAILHAQSTKQLQQKIDAIRPIAKAQSLLEAQLFLDLGEGISEENSLKLPVVETNGDKELVFDIFDQPNMNNLRLDPLNNSCVIEIKKISLLKKTSEIDLLDRMHTNACFIHNSQYFFHFDDPQIHFDDITKEELKGVTQLVLKCQFLQIGQEAISECITMLFNTNIEKDQELDLVKQEIREKDQELDVVKQEIREKDQELDVVKQEIREKDQEIKTLYDIAQSLRLKNRLKRLIKDVIPKLKNID